jgi:hypothetical protein
VNAIYIDIVVLLDTVNDLMRRASICDVGGVHVVPLDVKVHRKVTEIDTKKTDIIVRQRHVVKI